MTHLTQALAPHRRVSRRRDECGLNVETLEPRLTPAMFGASDVPWQIGPSPAIGDLIPVQQPASGGGDFGSPSGTNSPGGPSAPGNSGSSGGVVGFGEFGLPPTPGFTTIFPGLSAGPGFNFPSYASLGAGVPDQFSLFYRVPSPSTYDPYSLLLYRLPPPNAPPIQTSFVPDAMRFEAEFNSLSLGDQLKRSEHAFLNIYKVTQIDGRTTTERVALVAIDDGNVREAERILGAVAPGEYRLTLEDRSGEQPVWQGVIPFESDAARSELQNALRSVRERLELLREERDDKFQDAPLPPREEKSDDAATTESAWSEEVERLAVFLTWSELPSGGSAPEMN